MEVSNAQKWRITGVMMLALFLAFLDGTIVNVTLPQMQKAFHADFEAINWVVTAYFLAQAGVMPIVGYLSDRIGSKLVFMASLGLFTAGSLLCALAPTKEALIAFRVIQGIGGGAIVPMVFAIIFRVFPLEERSTATTVLGTVVIATSLGPTLGGYLSTSINWNAIFIVNVPCGIVALLLAFLILPRDKSEETAVTRKRLDIPGLLLSMVGFTVLVYGITQASSKGWGEQSVLIPLLIGVAALAAFVVLELRIHDPVMDLRLFKNSTFTAANLLQWITQGALQGSLFLLPFFFENVRGETALTAGMFLISQSLATVVGVHISGWLYKRVGSRVLMVSGLLSLAVGTYGLTRIDVNTTGQALQIWLILRGLGIGALNQPLQILTLSIVDNRAMAKASSLVNETRLVASAVGVAALTTYLTQQVATHAIDISNALKSGLQIPSLKNAAAATCTQFAGPTQSQAILKDCVGRHALVTGITDTFWIVMILCAVCTLVAIVVGRGAAVEVHKQVQAPGEVVHTNLGGKSAQVSKRESRPRISSARVRLVPMNTD